MNKKSKILNTAQIISNIFFFGEKYLFKPIYLKA